MTSRAVLSIVDPLCTHVFNNSDVRSKYISFKGLSGRVIPLGTFPTTDLALDFLYRGLCRIGFALPTKIYAQVVKIVRVTYDPQRLITQGEIIFTWSNDRRLTVFVALAFDKDYKLCGIHGQKRTMKNQR